MNTEEKTFLKKLKRASENPNDYKIFQRVPKYTEFPVYLSDNAACIDPQDIVVLDFETTGFDRDQDEGISIALVHITYDKANKCIHSINGSLSQLNEPVYNTISDRIAEFTGLTNEDVKGHSFNEREVEEFIGGSDTIIIAHNAAFDYKFFKKHFSNIMFTHGHRWACSFKDIDWWDYKIGSGKLEFILFSLDMFYDAHDALNDCFSVVYALDKCEGSLEKILSQMNKTTYNIRAINSPFSVKDDLKKNGFMWNGTDKQWICYGVTEEVGVEKLKVLDQLYGGGNAECIEKVDGNERFA